MRLARKVLRRWLKIAGDRKRVRELVKPINPPKEIPNAIRKDMGKTLTKGEDITKPDKKDIQPKDVFHSSVKNTGVRNLAETDRQLNEKSLKKNKGFETTNNLSQYLIRTEGGAEGGPEGEPL